MKSTVRGVLGHDELDAGGDTIRTDEDAYNDNCDTNNNTHIALINTAA